MSNLLESVDTPALLVDLDVFEQNIKACFATKDVGEAMLAFREKRQPVFQGR